MKNLIDYIAKHTNPMRDKYWEKDIFIFNALLKTLNKEELVKLKKRLGSYHPLAKDINELLSPHPKIIRNVSTEELLKQFANGVGKDSDVARETLQERIYYVAYPEQKMILKAFLLSKIDGDRMWAADLFDDLWDESLLEALKEHLKINNETKGDISYCNCLNELFYLPIEEVWKLYDQHCTNENYGNYCIILGAEERFVIDKNRLFPSEYYYIMGKLRRSVDEKEVYVYLLCNLKSYFETRHEYIDQSWPLEKAIEANGESLYISMTYIDWLHEDLDRVVNMGLHRVITSLYELNVEANKRTLDFMKSKCIISNKHCDIGIYWGYYESILQEMIEEILSKMDEDVRKLQEWKANIEKIRIY